MSAPRVCGACGNASSGDARFCGRCGTPFADPQPVAPPAPAPAPAPVAQPKMPQKTMLGLSLADMPGAPPQPVAPPAQPAPPADPAVQKTMLGVSLEPPPGWVGGLPTAAAVTAQAADPTLRDQKPPAGAQQRTMLGVAVDPAVVAAHAAALAKGAQPAQPVQPEYPAPPVQPAYPAQPVQPAYPAQPVQPAFPAQPAQPALGAQPAYPAQPAFPAQPAYPAQPVQPAFPAQPVQPAFPAEAVQPAYPAQPVQPAYPAQPVQPAYPAQPVQPAFPAQAAPPTQPMPVYSPPEAHPAYSPAQAALAAQQAPPDAGSAASRDAMAHPPVPAYGAPPPAQQQQPAPNPSVQAAKKALGPSNRTMLGMMAPAGAIEAAQAAAQARAQQRQQPAQPQHGMPSAAAAQAEAPMDVSITGLPSPARRGGRGALIGALLVLVLVMFIVVAALAYWRFGPRAHPIHVAVAQTAEGEVLDVEVPGAPAGARARFGGTEQPLANGRARFPLSAESLHVGDNPLEIDVISPGGATEAHRVTLTLELRVRADLSTLSAAAPAITVVVEALPGSSATLDGAPLPLDAQGRGSRAVPIASLTPGPDGVIQHVARWRVQPASGQPEEGTLTTRVPLSTLQIDRPGSDVVTDRDRVEIAGAVAPGSIVTVDGTPVTVTDGRFLHPYPLPAVGSFTPSIVARAPGRAPATRTITIRRVADLAQEAASFQVDASLTYARIAQSPAHFQGQRVALEGRVYNVDVQGGTSVLQMLVRDCPAGQRCPLWVTYPAATDVTVESWVRVLGTIGGEQQFRSESGQVRTVPRVDAAYVLPARP